MEKQTPTPPSAHPSASSKTTAPFETKNPQPQGAATSSAAAPPPPTPSMALGYFGALHAVLCVFSDLRKLGLLAGLEIPPEELCEARAADMFDRVVAAFLAEAVERGASRAVPPFVGAGLRVGLLRLYLAVLSRGGYAAVASWAAVAEAIGLEPGLGLPVKLVYAKYLLELEQRVYKPGKVELEALSNAVADQHLGAKKGELFSSAKGSLGDGLAHQKHEERGAASNAVADQHLVAKKSPGKDSVGAGLAYLKLEGRGTVSNAVADQLLGTKKDIFLSPAKVCVGAGLAHLKRKREAVVRVLDWVCNVAKSPNDPWAVSKNPDSQFSHALLLRREIFVKNDSKDVPRGSASPQSELTNEERVQHNVWDGLLSAGGSSDDEMRGAQIKLSGQADVPEWTGKPSAPYDDPDALRFLGTPILNPKEKEDALDADFIGKGRTDECECQFPGSIVCVRFHVVEQKLKLKRALGKAYYALGFDCMGEDLALRWTKEEKQKFNTIVRINLPSSRYNFWEKLCSVFPYKSSKDLVSYYYNVFQLRRRACQNRLTPNDIDSDDDSIEPGILHILSQGGHQGSSRYAASGSKKKDS